MLSGNLNGKTHINGNPSGISMSKRQKRISPVDIKKEKTVYEKRIKKIALPMCEKNGPDSQAV